MFYFLPDMAWLLQIFVCFATWLEHCAKKGKVPVPVFVKRSLGGLGLCVWYVFYDPLHAVCLGVALHLLGGVFWLLAYTNIIAGRLSPQERLDRVWLEVRQVYDDEDTPTRLPSLDIRKICDPTCPKKEFPILRCKAAEARCLIPVMHIVWLRLSPCKSDLHKHISKCLEHLSKFYTCLNYRDSSGLHPFILPDDILADLRKAVGSFLLHYTHIARSCSRAKMMVFSMTSKFHQLYHIGHDAVHINPRFSWTYHNESWMGFISTLGEHRGVARPAALRSKDICEGWILGQSIRLYHGTLETRAPVPIV